ncbi:MAG: hypothetical protein WCQ57_08130, partial [Verrucomicrobiota bacterium]
IVTQRLSLPGVIFHWRNTKSSQTMARTAPFRPSWLEKSGEPSFGEWYPLLPEEGWPECQEGGGKERNPARRFSRPWQFELSLSGRRKNAFFSTIKKGNFNL